VVRPERHFMFGYLSKVYGASSFINIYITISKLLCINQRRVDASRFDYAFLLEVFKLYSHVGDRGSHLGIG
jgi:hypothetical protein